MKKYTTKLLTLLLSVIVLASCSDFLDRNPTDRVAQDNVATLDDAENVVNGFYTRMKRNIFYGTYLMILGENRGDDFRPRLATGGYAAIYNYEFTPTNNTYGDIWIRGYNVLLNTNVFLNNWENVPASSTADIAKKNDLKGQALAVRALCHFELVKVYGYPHQKDDGASMGVVLADRVINVGEQQPRATVKEIYDLIISDLTEALTLLAKDKNHGNFNYWGAKGLLARAYLYKGDYDNAYKHANEMLADAANPYRLIPNANYKSSWANPDSDETMLELKVTTQSGLDNNGGVDSWYYVIWHGEGFAGANLIPTDAWFSILDEDPDDVRHSIIRTTTLGGNNVRWLAKFPGNTGDNSSSLNNPMIIRLSEVYLIAAEAALKKSPADHGKADEYLNAIRKRANPAATDVIATEELILKERRKELIGEGHRYYDLGRLGYTVDRSAADNKLPSGTKYLVVDPWNRGGDQHQVILPISQSQRSANPAALQNPGYAD